MRSRPQKVAAFSSLCALALAAAAPAALAQEPAKPRVLVLTFGKGDDGDIRDLAQGIAEDVLSDMGIPMVDSGQLLSRYQLEDLEKFLLLTPERARIAELKTRFGAEAIIAVHYDRDFKYEKEFLGSKHKFFKTNVRVKAIEPDTAAVIHSSGGQTTISARTNEIEDLVKEHTRRAAEALLKRWTAPQEGRPKPIQVVARGFDHDNLVRLETALKGVTGVLAVDRRDFGGPAIGEGNALIEVQADVSADDLARFLTGLQSPPVQVVNSTPSRIEVILARKLELGFVRPKAGELVVGTSVEAIVQGSKALTQVLIAGQPAQARGDGTFAATIGVQPGQNTIEASGQDDLGRKAVATVTFAVDGGPPQVRILSPAPGPVTKKRVRVEVEATDDGPIAQVTVNGVPARATEGARYVSEIELAGGQNTITAIATDRARLTGQAQVRVMLDAEPPTVKILAPAPGLTNKSRAVVEVEARDNLGPLTVTIDGRGMESIGNNRYRLAVDLSEGANQINVVATDGVGLSASASVTVNVDTTPPALEGAVIAVIEGAVEPGSQVTLEGRPVPVDENGRFRITVEAPVGGTVTIIATDAAGNETRKVYRIGGAAETAPQ